jgi:integrase
MATVRKRTWKTAKGEVKTAWIADYFDQHGARHQKVHLTKRAAQDWLVTTQGQVKSGTHTADSKSITVLGATSLWLERCKLRVRLEGDDKLEWSTERQYRSHGDHIARSSIAAIKLSRLTMPMVEAFKDELLTKGASSTTARKILTSLRTAIAEAQRRGLVAQNVAIGVKYGKRSRRPVTEGRDFPTKAELQAILAHAGKWYPLLVTAAFTGLRSSELRGLQWREVDFADKTLHVRRRADERRAIGKPKSAAGTRAIPLIGLVANALRPHRSSDPDAYVFCNSRGNVTFHRSIQDRGFIPVQQAAGIIPPKYGLHGLRHFYASWLISLKQYSPKEIQTMLGHASIQMTFDVYGGLFRKSEAEEDADRIKLEAASREFQLVAT